MTARRRMAMVLGTVLGVTACTTPSQSPAPASESPATSDPRSDGASNVRLVGYHDLQGRQSLVVTTKSDAANGNWVYVGHTPNDRSDPQASDDGQGNDQPILNPLTGKMEWNGTSIVEISDPARPRLVWHIPNDQAHVNSRSVSVVYDYGFDSEPAGRDYLIRSYDTGKEFKFQIYDITTRDSDPSKIALVSEITGTPPGNCGPGCGGPFIRRAHKGHWSQRSGLFYSSSGEPGFRGVTLIHIWDLKDPRRPKFVGRAASPSQREGQPGYQNEYAHHPIVDEPNNRLYIGFRGAGLAGSWDISNPASPKLVWMIDTSPPGRGPHTVSPITLRPGAELQRPRRPAAHLRLHHRRGRGRGRHEAVHERHPHQGLHGGHHRRDASVPGLDVAGAGGRLLREGRALRSAPARRDGERRDQPVRGQAGVGGVLQRRRARGRSVGSRTT